MLLIRVDFEPQELIHRTQEGAKLRRVVLQVPDQEVVRKHCQTNAEMLQCSSNREASFRGSRNLASKVMNSLSYSSASLR